MFKFRKKKIGDTDEMFSHEERQFDLLKDGKRVDNVNVDIVSYGTEDWVTLDVTSLESSRLLADARLAEFPKADILGFSPYDLLDDAVSLSIDIYRFSPVLSKSLNLKDLLPVEVYITPLHLNWKRAFTIGEYKEEFSTNLKGSQSGGSIFTEIANNASLEAKLAFAILGVQRRERFFGLAETFGMKLDFSDRPISVTLAETRDLVRSLHEKTITALKLRYDDPFITATFTFPDQITTQCQQYLLYFVRFLQDLGISATSDLTESAGQILYSVTPISSEDALDKIREALAVYLNLPSSPITYDDSFAAMRLQQQIDNLQHSQKMAARELQFTEKLLVAQSETIQEKNIIISQKDSTIDQQNRIIEKITSKSIMMDSLENKEEFEKIFEGLEFGESKWLKDNLGIKVNPVKSLKSLGGKLLRKDEEIVTLDLVEQEAENDANN